MLHVPLELYIETIYIKGGLQPSFADTSTQCEMWTSQDVFKTYPPGSTQKGTPQPRILSSSFKGIPVNRTLYVDLFG